MNGPAQATLSDVARAAHVSPKTVSRVMNREPNVREETRERVLAVARSLGYRPNPAARSLAASRSFLIGHLHDNTNRDYVGRTNDGIYAACRQAGYYLLPEPIRLENKNRVDRLDAYLDTSRVDGVVLTPPLADDPVLVGRLVERGVSFVLISPQDEASGLPMVRLGQRNAARRITDHLIQLGHRNIAFIAGPLTHGAAVWRQTGYEEAVAAAGLEPGPFARGDFTFRSGIAAAETLLVGPDKPTAVFAANDHMAAGVIAFAMKAGLTVPEHLSVAGFDDTEMGEAMWPPLTTIRQPIERMGELAARLIMEPDAEDLADAAGVALMDYELIVRESTGPVPE